MGNGSETRLELRGGPEIVRRARKWAADRARLVGLPADAVVEVALAVSEACTNIVRHAYAGQPEAHIVLTVTDDDRWLTFRLRDFGRKFDPATYHPPDLDALHEGGYGLFLIQQVMDEVRYITDHEQGTELILRKRKRVHDAP